MLVVVGGIGYNEYLTEEMLNERVGTEAFALHDQPELRGKVVYSPHNYEWSLNEEEDGVVDYPSY